MSPVRAIRNATSRRTAWLLAAGIAFTMPVAADPTMTIYRDGFEGAEFAAEGGLYYKENNEQKAGTVAFRAMPDAHAGKGILELSVRPTCRSESAQCSERAEIWEEPGMQVGYAQSVWYGLSVRQPAPIPTDDNRYVLAQWKRQIIPGADGDYSPFLAIRIYKGRLGITIESDRVEAFPLGKGERAEGCKAGEALVNDRRAFKQTRALVATEGGPLKGVYPGSFNACAPSIQIERHADLPSLADGWVDFVIRSRPGPAGDGHVEIIANGRRIVTVKGRIGHAGPGLGEKQYFKFGPYRAPTDRVWTVHYDSFRRGPRCQDVIIAGQCPAE